MCRTLVLLKVLTPFLSHSTEVSPFNCYTHLLLFVAYVLIFLQKTRSFKNVVYSQDIERKFTKKISSRSSKKSKDTYNLNKTSIRYY